LSCASAGIVAENTSEKANRECLSICVSLRYGDIRLV
jgi:hypothetical protein